MAYTLKQLTMAWTAVHDGLEPDAATLAQLQLRTNASFSDADALSYVLNSADNSTALAVLAYQFFTGKSPSKAGLEYLVNSSTNPNDLNDAYYAKFGLENRYINFAANLGVQGEGSAAFSTKYAAMSFADYVASIYETIIGSSYAKAAGIDAAKAIADIASRQAAILATARDAGMITPNMTQAQIDLAVKAATAGYLLGEAIKADVGLYAGAANNFMVALAMGTATYNTDITTTYKPAAGQGTGQAANTTPTLPGLPPPPPVAYNFTLTTGGDTFSGDIVADNFNATAATFNANDKLDGGAGADILTITAATGGTYTVAAATIMGIETANISNNAGVIVDSTAWTGVTKLNVTDTGTTIVTAGATTDVSIINPNLNGGVIGIDGGHNVNLTTTLVGGGLVGIGDVTKATGAIVADITNPTGTGGMLSVKGGTSIDVTVRATNPVGVSQTSLSASILGSSLTTAVTLKGSPVIASSGSAGGNGGSLFTIIDANINSNTTVGTIQTLAADGFVYLEFNGSGLSTLTASHGATIVLHKGQINGPTTLNATLSGITNSFSDQNVYTTLNLTRGAEASSFSLSMNALTTLNISGSGALTFTGGGLSNLQTITVTGSGALDLHNVALSALTTLNGATATGAITAYVDASIATVTTGAGADYIDPGATISHAISLGAGNDTIYVEGATITATVNGGDGADTVFLDATSAASLIPYLGYLVNFERIHFDNGNNFTVDMAPLGYHYVVAEDGNGFTLNGMSSGDTLALFKNGISYIVGSANFGGASDSFNLALQTTGSSALAYGSVSLSGVETVAITLDDTRATPTGTALNTVSVLDTAAKIITISGDAGLELTTNSNALTLVDASGITTGDFTWTTAAPNVSLTVKGSAHGTNTFTINGIPTAGVTYEGGTGDDIVTLLNDNSFNVVHLGAGNNYFEGDATSVTAGAGDDYVKTSATGSVIDLGGGHNVLISFSDAVHYTGGGGFDDLFVAAGANVIDVGSGNDRVEIDAIDASSATVFTSITGMGAGDKLTFGSGAANNSAATTMGAQTTLTGTHTLAEYLDAASTDVAGTTNALHWFVMGSDLYIVSDRSDAATFVDGQDVVVKLVGAASLASTMGTTTVASSLITFH